MNIFLILYFTGSKIAIKYEKKVAEMEIKKILIPIGGSAYSKNALQYAILFAKKFEAELLGIYVKDIRLFKGPQFSSVADLFISEPYFEIDRDNIEASLNGRGAKIKDYFTSICKNDGIKCSFQIQKGLVSDVIIDIAKEVDLVVMGKKGEHANLLKRHLGSTCTRVIHNINRPLVIVDYAPLQEIRKVLLCYAGGYFAQKALDLTQYFIAKTGFGLSVLTIATKQTIAIAVQKEAKKYFISKNTKANYLLTVGDVEKEIMKIAKTEDIDMLITGASMHKSYEDFLSLCLANRILYDSNIPILFVR